MRKFVVLFTMFMLCGVFVFAQQRSITGRVIDGAGAPLEGVSVLVKNTNAGTSTDANGRFTINAENGSVLVFTGVGFESQEQEVGNENNLTIELQAMTQTLDQVVVTALGIKRQEKSLGYGTTTVSSTTLNESKPVTVSEGLQGKVAGLQINTIDNGVDPGMRVILRGYRHINADNQALIVVDGQAVRNNFLNALNPNDIEDITVLKGASSAALYGVDATNGVIVVTTKRGAKDGRPRVEFNHTTMLESVSYMPELQSKFAPGSGETGPYPWDPTLFFTDPYTGIIQYVPYENQNYGMEFNGDPKLGYIGGPAEDGSFLEQPFKALDPDPRRAFFQTGHRIQNNVSISGGDADDSYMISVQDVVTKGTVPKDQGRRTSLYVSGTKTYGRFSATFNLSYSQRYGNTVGGDFNQGRPVYWNLMNQGANIPLNDPRINDPSSTFFLDNYYNAYYPNPWWQIYNSRRISRTNYFNGQLSLNFKAADWLNFTYRAGTNFTSFNQENSIASVNFTPYAVSDPWEAGNTASSVGLHKNGSITLNNGSARAITQDVMATMNRKFGDIGAQLVLGNTIAEKPYSSNRSRSTEISSSQLFIDGFYNPAFRLGELNGSYRENMLRTISGFADLTLDYKNFLFLHSSFRRDWSSLLPKGNNAYNFYGIDGSFVFTDALPQLKSAGNGLSYGKVRAAWSKTGQITVGPYSFSNVFVVASGYPFGGQAGMLRSGTLNNPNLKPESTREYEFGVEVGFWNSRINLDATYYHQLTSGQTFPVQVSETTGYGAATLNAGEVMNQGVELGVTADLIRNPTGISWTAGATYSWNDSEVLSMFEDVKDFLLTNGDGTDNRNHAVVGHPFPVLETNDLQRDPATNKIVVNKSDGYPILVDTLNIIGRTLPKDMLNLNSTLRYKNFSLQAVVSYRGGNVFYANIGQQIDFSGATQHTAVNNRERFIYPNSVVADGSGHFVDNDQYHVRDGGRGFYTVSPFSDAGTSYVVNAAFWKLRSVTLSYDFHDIIRDVKFLRDVKLSLVGKNLWMARPSQNVWTDPEFNEGNVNGVGFSTYNQLPPTRQYGVSLDVTF